MASLRDVLLAEVDRWSFPVTDWELATVKEIERLPVVTAHRMPAAQLEWMRMEPRECHANARFMEAKDPDRRMKQVIGWWPQGDHYVLHSVVRNRLGQYVCVTPVDAKLVPDTQFDFVPDLTIEVREESGVRSCYRDGVQIGAGVRRDPAQSLANAGIVRQRLLSGIDAYEAVKLP